MADIGRWAPKHYVDSLQLPTLVVHGEADKIVPPKFGREIFEELNIPGKNLWLISGFAHTAAFTPNSPYRQKLLDYLENIMGIAGEVVP